MAMAFGDGEDGVDDLKFWAFCFWLLALGFGFRGRFTINELWLWLLAMARMAWTI